MKRKHRGWKIALCVVLALVVCIAGTQTAIYFHRSEPASVKPYIGSFRYITTDGKAMVSAHRSGGDLNPEESMAAFKNCVESKDFQTDIFEFDLHITKDGVLFSFTTIRWIEPAIPRRYSVRKMSARRTRPMKSCERSIWAQNLPRRMAAHLTKGSKGTMCQMTCASSG